MIKKVFVLGIFILSMFLSMQPSDSREFTEKEQEIYNEYSEREDAIKDMKPPVDYDQEVRKLKSEIANKYNLTINELDEIIGGYWKEKFYKLFLQEDE